jgi:short-subunit dehydrogenase
LVPDRELLNKIAVITGASSGIGRATALALAREGAHLALGARNEKALEEVAGEIQALGCETLVLQTDVTNQEQVQRLVESTLERWGRVDILIANAGQYIQAPIRELTVSDMEASMAVNFYGGLYAILAVLPHMLERHSGHVVIVSTMDTKTPIPPDSPYVAAKTALRGFGEVLRQELYGTGVHVSIILPGRVDTPMIEALNFAWVSSKISPETVASEILRAISRRKVQVVLPPQAYLFIILRDFFPRLADWAARAFRLEGWKVNSR